MLENVENGARSGYRGKAMVKRSIHAHRDTQNDVVMTPNAYDLPFDGARHE